MVDLFLDMRKREDQRQDLQEGWKLIKKGVLQDDPNTVAEGQVDVKTVIFSVMNEAMT